CAGSGGVELPGSGSGGVGQLSYSWTPVTGLDSAFIATPTANPTSTTTYQLVVTDSYGCSSDPASVTVVVNPLPIANAGSDQTICKGTGQGVFLDGSAQGAVFGSYSYQWIPSTGLSNPNIQNPYATPDTTTVYTLVVTSNQTGCSSDSTNIDTLSTVIVYVETVPVANGGPDVEICQGGSIQIGDAPTGGGPIYSYQWSPTIGLNNPNTMTPIASPLYTTTYYLTVISNGCISKADTVIVTVKAAPTAEAGPNQSICPGDSVQLSGLAGGVPGPYTWRWEPALGLSDPTAQNPLASPAVTTLYKLYASANGCEGAADSVLITVKPKPIVDADPNNLPLGYEICSGNTVTLNGTVSSILQPVTFVWTPTDGLSNPQILNPTASPDQTTMYYLSATAGGCTSTDSVLVRVLNSIQVSVTTSADTICSGSSVTLSASGGVGDATFTWSPSTSLNRADTSDVIASPTATTVYTVTVSEGGCVGRDSIRVVVLPNPQVAFSNSSTESCGSLTVSFFDQSVGATAITWDFGDGSSVTNVRNPIHTYSRPGSYVVTVTGYSPGCSVSQSTVSNPIIVREPVVADFTSNPMPGSTITLPDGLVQFQFTPAPNTTNPAVRYFWSFGDGQSSSETNPAHLFEQPGNYTVRLVVEDALGCSDTVENRYTIIQPNLEIPNVFTPNGDGVNDEFLIRY
ncbi:MAG: PKD domain-containing protein, partial [Bacteroidia bacterium]|nr:PKD domain-containing protein [Bacteroidia bacterium]